MEKKVKYFFVMMLLVLLPACSHPVVSGNEKIEKMERREVVRAANECEDYKMRPYVEYVTQRTEFGKVLVPIAVHCEPVRK
jgi:hypothetical protein